MSWPYFKAAAALRLPTSLKVIALALGDFSESDGSVLASNARIRGWTGQSHQTVRQGLRGLHEKTMLATFDPGNPLRSPCYWLKFPGVQTPLESRAPLALRALKLRLEGVNELESNDRSLIPSNKSNKQGAARPLPVETVENPDAPTEAQLFALSLKTLTAEGFSSLPDYFASVKATAARLSGFDYAANVDRLNKAMMSALHHYEQGRRAR